MNKKIILIVMMALLLISCKEDTVMFKSIIDELDISNLEIISVELLKDYSTTDFNVDDYKMIVESLKQLKVYKNSRDLNEAISLENNREFFLRTSNEEMPQMNLVLFSSGYIRIITYDYEKMPETLNVYEVIDEDKIKLLEIIENF